MTRDDAAPMVVGVEATRLVREVRGIGRYIRALLPRMLAQRPNLDVVLFVRPRDVEALAAIHAAYDVTRGRVDVRAIDELKRTAADVFWYPWNVASPLPRRGAVVVTMHDVAPLALPDPRLRKWRKNWRWRRRYRAAERAASLIVVDSAFTAEEVHRELGVAHDRMRVVPLAADDMVSCSPDGDAAQLARLAVRRPFVLVVGADDRRKNIAMAETAVAQVRLGRPEVSLVLAGPRSKTHAREPVPWKYPLGFVNDEALVALYRAASCLVMPSTYEGFGLPVLEAMRLGTPVVCVRSSSLPEVGGDAVLWVEPNVPSQLAAAVTRVVSDRDMAADLRARGLARAATFSWNETARRTLAAFDDAITIEAERQAQAATRVGWRSRARALASRLRPRS